MEINGINYEKYPIVLARKDEDDICIWVNYKNPVNEHRCWYIRKDECYLDKNNYAFVRDNLIPNNGWCGSGYVTRYINNGYKPHVYTPNDIEPFVCDDVTQLGFLEDWNKI